MCSAEKILNNSTNEFKDIISGSNVTGILASLDVDSLFTNSHVKDTIKNIMNQAYFHSDITPSKISQDIMQQLLIACTTKTHFLHPNGDIYLQVDGVSMGSL